MPLVRLTDLSQRPPTILAYGKAGTGKTLLATSGGQGTIVVDWDQGLTSLRHFQDNFSDDRKQINVLPCYRKSIEDNKWWSRGREEMAKLSEAIRTQYKKGDKSVKCVVIDSLTEMFEAAKLEYASVSGLQVQGIKNPTQQLWGILIEDVIRTIGVYLSLPCPVILVAHTMAITIGDDDNQRTEIRLNTYGKSAPQRIPNLFDEFWYFHTVKKGGKLTYVVQTEDSNMVEAKSRGSLKNDFPQSIGLVKILSRLGWDYHKADFKPLESKDDTGTETSVSEAK